MFNTEATVSYTAAQAAISLIKEYLYQGGTGNNAVALEEMLSALNEADRIVIEPSTQVEREGWGVYDPDTHEFS